MANFSRFFLISSSSSLVSEELDADEDSEDDEELDDVDSRLFRLDT